MGECRNIVHLYQFRFDINEDWSFINLVRPKSERNLAEF
jgi:hypothetical protein